MFRFLHAADLHLDSPLRGLEQYEGAPVSEIRGAARLALQNLVRLAIEEKVDFVLLAGDIYDGDWEDVSTGHFFTNQMSVLNQHKIPVYLIAGNHDAENQMTASLPFPPNIRRFDTTRPETHRDDKLRVAIHGQSYGQRAVTTNLALEYPAAIPGYFNIGILHTSLNGREGHERYAPCTVAELVSRNYHYWALGHIHQRESIEAPSNLRIEFPGNIQGRHIRETGAKGCLLVTVDDAKKTKVDFRPLDVFRWHLVSLDCTTAASLEDVLSRLTSHLEELQTANGNKKCAIRLELTGETSAHSVLMSQMETFQDQVRQCAANVKPDYFWVEKIRVKTCPVSEASIVRPVFADAVSEIEAVIENFRSNPEELKPLVASLRGLRTKINLLGLEQGEDAVHLADEQWLVSLLDEARAHLDLDTPSSSAP